jgi:hypothetical protein
MIAHIPTGVAGAAITDDKWVELLPDWDNQIRVLCGKCGEPLDVVPDARTAYWRVQQYSDHTCLRQGPVGRRAGEQ